MKKETIQKITKAIIESHERTLAIYSISREPNEVTVRWLTHQFNDMMYLPTIKWEDWCDEISTDPSNPMIKDLMSGDDKIEDFVAIARYRGEYIFVGIDDYGQQMYVRFRGRCFTSGSYCDVQECLMQINDVLDREIVFGQDVDNSGTIPTGN